MAGEIQADYLTGRTLYAQVRSATATIWNTAGGAFEAYNTANIADYDIALTEQGTASGYYAGNMPAATGGVYNVIVKVRAGGAPAETDVTIAAGQIEWDGSAVEPLFGAAVNTVAISGDSAAADALETMLDGTGGSTLSLGRLVASGSAAGGVIMVANDLGPAVNITTSSGDAVTIESTDAVDGDGVNIVGAGTGSGLRVAGGATGHGLLARGGATSGDGIRAQGVTSGHGLNLIANGATAHGLLATGGSGGVSDGVRAVAGTGGVPIRGNITGNITGQLSSDSLDLVLVDGKTLPRAIAIIGGVVAGKVSGAGTGTEVFLGFNGSDVAATVQVDGSGNRTSVTY